VTKLPTEAGVGDAYYEKIAPTEAYNIPFTRTAVDKLLEGKTPFGPDSVNITDPARVVFVAKIQNVLGVKSLRPRIYLRAIHRPEWSKIVEFATRPGGPTQRMPIWLAAPEECKYGVH
jgi:hypothetical protein